MMDRMGFDSDAISSAVSIAGAVSLPLPFIVGWLSDRLGRYRLLGLCYLAAALSLVIHAGSTSLWQFWLAAIVGTAVGASSGVGQALVTDLVPPESLSVGLSRYGATNWVAGVIGFGGTGYAIQALGMSTTFVVSGLITLISIVLLVQVQRVRQLALA